MPPSTAVIRFFPAKLAEEKTTSERFPVNDNEIFFTVKVERASSIAPIVADEMAVAPSLPVFVRFVRERTSVAPLWFLEYIVPAPPTPTFRFPTPPSALIVRLELSAPETTTAIRPPPPPPKSPNVLPPSAFNAPAPEMVPA